MSSSGRRHDVWRSAERHYCEVCNAWMGSDRQSILLHENGKKHQQNLEKASEKRGKEKQAEERSQKLLQESLQAMERNAIKSHLRQDASIASSQLMSRPPNVATKPLQASNKAPPAATPAISVDKGGEEKLQLRRRNRENDDEGIEEADQSVPKRKIEPGEGHYQLDGKTYLEGPTFVEILEPDMPIQLWRGHALASLAEKRLSGNHVYWANAIVLSVRGQQVHVSYLLDGGDDREQIEKNVSLDRIRIILGADKAIPDTLEEARIMGMGGEIVIKTSENELTAAEVDEATGFSAWSTTEVKKTTVRQEQKEENERARARRREAIKMKSSVQMDRAKRKMDELKSQNWGDSALGVYGSNDKSGYKGVNIAHVDESKLTVMDTTAKTLSSGPVAFKKRKKIQRKNVRRTTSADD